MKKLISICFLLFFVVTGNAQENKKPKWSEINKENAIALRNTGIVLTIAGTVIAGAGFFIFGNASNGRYSTSPGFKGALENWGAGVGGFGLGCVGIVITGVGIPLWIIGGYRKANAEIAFKKFDLRTTNSTIFGIGLTVRF